jgi:hypothetical protein
MGKPRGYNIKYIDPLPGNKTKRAMYEIKPGVWVIRTEVPEIKLQRKITRNKPEIKFRAKKYWDNYYAQHKETLLKKARLLKKNNKEKYWKINNRRNNSERGFIMNLYTSANKESKSGRRGKKVPFDFTKKTWWEHWLKQKKRYGMYCPYSKVLMTTIRGLSKGMRGAKRVVTNISKDQIWPGRGYTPMNLIFCTVKFNLEKKGITPDGCEAVVDVHRERMDNWAKETTLKRELRKIDISQPENLKYFRKEFKKFKRSVSETEYKCFIDIAYQKSVAEREEEQKLYKEWIKMGQPSREEWEKKQNARS